MSLFKRRSKYSESDHFLTHVYNLFSGGTCLEDINNLAQSEPIRRLIGTRAVPDPTTAGDFLRRFDKDNLEAVDAAIDEAHEQVWRRRYGNKKRPVAIVDLDSHVKVVFGSQKEGADLTYKGTYGFHPLVISLAGSNEVLRILNRWGNVASAEGAAMLLEQVIPLLKRNFHKIIIRGDAAFARQELFDLCEEHGLYFAVVSAQHENFEGLADSIALSSWKPFSPYAEHKPDSAQPKKRRKKGENLRRATMRQRGKRDLLLKKQWLAQIPYEPARSEHEFRLVIRRQKIEEFYQQQLFEHYRYRYVLTNLPVSVSAHDVMLHTYKRCDQENIIEQLQHGVTAMRMPSASFAANSALLLCARVAFNLKSWLAMLALSPEVARWEWKRFRNCFLYCAAIVVKKARQTIVRFCSSHRFARSIADALVKLQI